MLQRNKINTQQNPATKKFQLQGTKKQLPVSKHKKNFPLSSSKRIIFRFQTAKKQFPASSHQKQKKTQVLKAKRTNHSTTPAHLPNFKLSISSKHTNLDLTYKKTWRPQNEFPPNNSPPQTKLSKKTPNTPDK